MNCEAMHLVFSSAYVSALLDLQLFVELNELIVEKDHEMRWKERARWIKFEEDVEEETDRWGKPHVASLSFRSLLELRRTITHGKRLLHAYSKADAHSTTLIVYLFPCAAEVNSSRINMTNKKKQNSSTIQCVFGYISQITTCRLERFSPFLTFMCGCFLNNLVLLYLAPYLPVPSFPRCHPSGPRAELSARHRPSGGGDDDHL